MRLLRPELLSWLLALPFAVACWILHYQYKWRQRRRMGGAERTSKLSRRSNRGSDVAVLLFSAVTISFLAGALARPQLPLERRTPEFERQDLVLILDRSISMRARDIRPSRFARAAEEITNFLRRKPAAIDRVGLVAFAGTAVVLSYPTADFDALSFYLDWVADDPTTLFGTDIGAALTVALDMSRREPQRIRPMFVVISDGEDHGRELERATAAVQKQGIRVHAIGIGSHESVPMPIATRGGRDELLMDAARRVVMTRFDETTLQRLAALTGGRYFRSTTGGELVSALESIAEAERRQTGWTARIEYRDLYLPLLAGAAAAAIGLVALL
jgi:Ca-activated chloride channel family protein